jgi:two-component system, OmpR family, response regulator
MPSPSIASRQTVFTTFEIAQMLSVDIGAVIRWVNQGKLKAFRTPGRHRRVQKSDLLSFLETYQMPVPHAISRPHPLILLVEDEALVRMGLKAMIQDMHRPFLIEEAADGFEAGKKMSELAPDLVVLDVRLPGVDGFRICQEIRADSRLAASKILVVSGQLTADERRHILSCGADDVLAKPVDPEEFKTKIAKLLQLSPDSTE